MAKKKLDNTALITFCDSMAMMLRSGIQIDEAITLMMEDSDEGMLGTAVKLLHERLEEGCSFSGAVEKSDMFPSYTVKMLAMGEHAGRLDSTLKSLAVYYSRQLTFTRSLSSAMKYPSIIMAIISAILVIMIAWVMPVFTGVYERLAGSLDSSSYSYVLWAKGLCWAALIIMVVLIAVMLAGTLMLKTDNGRRITRSVLFIMPRFRSAVKNSELCRFFSIFILMFNSGTDEDTAAAEAQKVISNKEVIKKIEECRAEMSAGKGFVRAAHDTKLLKPEYGIALLSGDKSGDTEAAIRQVTDLLERDYCNELDEFLAVTEPILSGTLLLVVGMSLTSVMLPLISMMNTIG